MEYEYVKQLKAKEFKQITGVTPKTFEIMLTELKKIEQSKRCSQGRKFMLSLEDQLLLTLKYWREYPPIFNLVASYRISENTCKRIIHFIGNTLSKSEKFKLLGKKMLQGVSETEDDDFIYVSL